MGDHPHNNINTNGNRSGQEDDTALCRALAEAAALRKQLGERDIERFNLKAQLEDMRVELSETKHSCTTMKTSLERLDAHSKQLHSRLVLSEQLRISTKKRLILTSSDRVKRKIFNEKLNSLAKTHARTTAHMLNVQKRCFEEELEALEGEAKATISTFEQHISELQNQVHATHMEKLQAENAAKHRHSLVLQLVKQRDTLRNQCIGFSHTIQRKNAVIDQLQVQLDTTLAQLKNIRLGNANTNANTMPKNTTTDGNAIAAITPNPVVNLASRRQVDDYKVENKRLQHVLYYTIYEYQSCVVKI